MRHRHLVLAPLLALAACVTLPPYERRFDDAFDQLQEQVYDHYAAIELDGLCDPAIGHAFWQGARRSVDLLALRASYTPDYEGMHDQLLRLRARLDEFEGIETTRAAGQAAKGLAGRDLCLPAPLAHAGNVQLRDEIGALQKLELTWKRGAR